VLHALVARADTRQLQGIVGALTRGVQRFMDPTVPAIPERKS
jgi:hypothetical protein